MYTIYVNCQWIASFLVSTLWNCDWNYFYSTSA